jgi:alkylated DNA repair protein alkB family protein 6
MDFKKLLALERARAKAAAAESTTDAVNNDAFETFTDTPTTPIADADAHRRRLGGVNGLSYARNFIGAKDAIALERALLREPAAWWTAISNGRRVMNVGGGSPSTLFVEGDETREPGYVSRLRALLVHRRVFTHAPNHVLVNEYVGDAGILAHSDGDVYADDVAIITLRGGALIEFWPATGDTISDGRDDEDEDAQRVLPRPVVSVYLEPRSVLMYSGDAYRLRHGIRRKKSDVITDACVNASDAGVRVGDIVKRNPAGRVSVVFVRKHRAPSKA